MNRSHIIRIVVLALIFIVGVAVAYQILKPEEKLRIYNPAELNPKLVDVSVQDVSSRHAISDFRLTSQQGKTITPADFEGKIYVADFFFTTCQSICPKMSTQMKRVHDAYREKPEVMILSHSVTPEIDSVPVLAEYAKKYSADPEKWIFVTGDKKQIYDLARKSYFAATTEGDGGPDDFIHTENFVLIDKEKRIRGFYDGTSKEDVDRLIEEIEILLEEYEQKETI